MRHEGCNGEVVWEKAHGKHYEFAGKCKKCGESDITIEHIVFDDGIEKTEYIKPLKFFYKKEEVKKKMKSETKKFICDCLLFLMFAGLLFILSYGMIVLHVIFKAYFGDSTEYFLFILLMCMFLAFLLTAIITINLGLNLWNDEKEEKK